MLLAALIVLVILAIIAFVVVTEPPSHWPPSPDQHQRDLDMRRHRWPM